MADELRHAWAAGFLDGEGCFTLAKRAGFDVDVSRQPSISASQIASDPLQILADLFGGRVRFQGVTKGGHDVHQWAITESQLIVAAIDKLGPFLVNKKCEAEIVGEFASLVRRGKTVLSTDEISHRRRLISELEIIRNSIRQGNPVYKEPHPRKKSPCGTDASYQRGCHCVRCRSAHAKRGRQYRARQER
jgi:hypothetical protein